MRRIPTNRTSRSIFAAGTLLAALGTLAGGAWYALAGASGDQSYGDAIRSLAGGEADTPAAVVDGQAIPMSKILAHRVLMAAGSDFGYQDGLDDQAYLDVLIDNQVLYQEAVRRGLMPSDEEVKAQALAQKKGLQEFIRGDSPDAEKLRAQFAQVKGTPYDLDTYDLSSVILDGVRQSIAINAIRVQIIQTLPRSEQGSPEAVGKAVAGVIADLRAKADVHVVAKLP